MKIFTEDNKIAVEIELIESKGENLVIWGKILGTMRMKMYLTTEELINTLKITNWKVLFYIVLFPYFVLKLGLRKLSSKKPKR